MTLTQTILGIFKRNTSSPPQPQAVAPAAPKPSPALLPQMVQALRDTDAVKVRELCQQGVDVNGDTGKHFTHSPLPLFNILAAAATPARAQEARDCFKAMLDHGLTLSQDRKKQIYAHVAVLAPLVPDVQQAMAFRDALAGGDAAGLDSLLGAGADIDCGKPFGEQPAIITAAQKGHVAVISVLLANGASLQTMIANDSRTLPLNQAAIHGQRAAFVSLLDAGANANHMWSDGDGFWTVNGMAKKCTTDPGMAKFVADVISARENTAAPDVEVKQAINIRRPIALKK